MNLLRRLPMFAIVFAVLLMAFAPSAHATPVTFSFSYTGLTGTAGSASGLLYTTTTSTPGQYLIVGISGSRNGSAITALDPIGTDGSDNLLFWPGTPQLTFGGVSFMTADGGDWNIYFNNPYFEGYASGPNFNQATGEISFSATPVPEPGSLLLIGTGLIGVAGVARRRVFGSLS